MQTSGVFRLWVFALLLGVPASPAQALEVTAGGSEIEQFLGGNPGILLFTDNEDGGALKMIDGDIGNSHLFVGAISECTNGQTQPCGTDVGACEFGTQTCEAGAWSSCQDSIAPAEETCNGLDDDCDGTTDEGCVVDDPPDDDPKDQPTDDPGDEEIVIVGGCISAASLSHPFSFWGLCAILAGGVWYKRRRQSKRST